jgi:hypothetical protein
MAQQDSEAMLWFGGRWWWFPGAQIGTESEFEWRGGKGFLLDLNGKTVEGIEVNDVIVSD